MGSRISVLNHGLGIVPDLDAHMADILQHFVVGDYYSFVPVRAFSTEGMGGSCYAYPFYVNRPITLDRIAVQVTTLQDPGAIRICIFNDNGSYRPGTVLVDGGSLNVATTGVKAATISQALARGVYWWGVKTASATAVYKKWSPAIMPIGFPTDFSGNIVGRDDTTQGSDPSVAFVTWTDAAAATWLCPVWGRIASLD